MERETSTVKNTSKDSPTTLMVQLRTRKQELEADALGFKLMMWTIENGNDPIGQMTAATRFDSRTGRQSLGNP